MRHPLLLIICCSPWWPFPYLLGVGRVLHLHSFRSRATSWVTPTPVMSSLICWCHVFLGRSRRLVHGITRSVTLHVALFKYLLWTCPNQRRQPLHITSSIGASCNMRLIFFVSHVIPSRNSEDLTKLLIKYDPSARNQSHVGRVRFPLRAEMHGRGHITDSCFIAVYNF